jgi:hypothetical protein
MVLWLLTTRFYDWGLWIVEYAPCYLSVVRGPSSVAEKDGAWSFELIELQPVGWTLLHGHSLLALQPDSLGHF